MKCRVTSMLSSGALAAHTVPRLSHPCVAVDWVGQDSVNHDSALSGDDIAAQNLSFPTLWNGYARHTSLGMLAAFLWLRGSWCPQEPWGVDSPFCFTERKWRFSQKGGTGSRSPGRTGLALGLPLISGLLLGGGPASSCSTGLVYGPGWLAGSEA